MLNAISNNSAIIELMPASGIGFANAKRDAHIVNACDANNNETDAVEANNPYTIFFVFSGSVVC